MASSIARSSRAIVARAPSVWLQSGYGGTGIAPSMNSSRSLQSSSTDGRWRTIDPASRWSDRFVAVG
ncbi:hypothetical protein [Desertimonas flava]|uniref:hypothetical protein n=1 Tax=Desertimonas flava TaxID=2064846 RepID=UPI000E3454F8|nr:hypothetical protein [Desertimonas flava]